MYAGAALKNLLSKGFGAAKAFSKDVPGKIKAFGKGVPGKVRAIKKATRRAVKPGGTLSAMDKGRSFSIDTKTLAKGPRLPITSYNPQKDFVYRAAKRLGSGTSSGLDWLGKPGPVKSAMGKLGHNALAAARSPLGKTALRGGFALGALSMVGINIMKGGMNEAKEIVHERYMQDYTYSRSMLHNSRIGLASGTNTMLNKGGTQGLTLGLSKTRHGRY